jgi:hypothetical protein
LIAAGSSAARPAATRLAHISFNLPAAMRITSVSVEFATDPRSTAPLVVLAVTGAPDIETAFLTLVDRASGRSDHREEVRP